jgi:2-dehydro-3-deoxy-D-arabinonate dehydratase
MRLFHSNAGAVVEHDGRHRALPDTWDDLINRPDLRDYLHRQIESTATVEEPVALRPPIGSQEVWAAGVTYYRSRDARMEESQAAGGGGGGSFYDRVYAARRPELFFKSAARRVVAPGMPVRIRRDSRWNVPEPELALVINPRAQIVGYTVGNDMSSRDIEGENPLYLPQAKVYDGSCALGPCVLVPDDGQPPPPETAIAMTIRRTGREAFAGRTTLAGLKRSPSELVEYLYRETSFPAGCVLFTGTGVVPPPDFSLEPGDVVSITIDRIGTLSNPVERRP